MSKLPDMTGRAFEVIVFDRLIHALKSEKISASYTEQALAIHESYIPSYNELVKLASTDNKVQKIHQDFTNNTHFIVEWIIDYFDLRNTRHVLLHKLKDSEAGEGNVADIQLQLTFESYEQTVNLSLKNNHSALKHSRINPLPKWINIPKESKEHLDYNLGIQAAQNKVMDGIHYMEKIRQISIVRYSDLDQLDKSIKRYSTKYKNAEVYPVFYEVIKNFFEKQATTAEDAKRLFRYLMSEPHYKIINVPNKEFQIFNFTEVPDASSVTFSISKRNGYLKLNFNNGYDMEIRLHNDVGEIERSFNYKCDIQLAPISELNITPIVIKKSSIK